MRRKPVQGPVHSMDQDSVESLEDEDNFVQPHEDHPGRARSGGEEEDGMGSTASTNTTDENLMRDHSLSGWTDSRLHIVNPDEKASKSLIITNVDSEIFDNPVAKEMFEKLFTEYDDDVIFHYLKSFGRVRIDLSSAKAASNAKERSHNLVICGKVINCYFLQVFCPFPLGDPFLHVPPLEKQFLISPPASPPVGWEQPKEDKPIVNYDLLTAMAELGPGQRHELHPKKEVKLLGKSVSTPSIVVHIAEDEALEANSPGAMFSRKITQTRCPNRQNSLK
ncbi:calcipressin-2-like [Tigriopus californicus]|uniref:calcipressin-2-like n=1 Tax=Tigriopus californicus TaxID=6832 RepID=UPI0027DA67BB|nr:calcipressin-2-like [Tigriopus californicus]